jgi:lipid-binding SYLF domain-containing protein
MNDPLVSSENSHIAMPVAGAVNHIMNGFHAMDQHSRSGRLVGTLNLGQACSGERCLSALYSSKENPMALVVRTLISTMILSLFVMVSFDPALAKSAEEIDAETNQALDTLYAESSAAKELGAKAAGVLVFPSITKGGFIVGGEYGEGALRVGGKTQGYYSSASGSIGLQIGISSRTLVIMFMTDEALKKFTSADGWEAGVDADVTVVQTGATGSLDTTTAQSPVIAFNFGESGLMAGVSVEGTKVTKLDR